MGRSSKKSRPEWNQPPHADAVREDRAAQPAARDQAILQGVRDDLIPYINERLASSKKPRRNREPLGVSMSGWAGQCRLQHRYSPQSPLLVGFNLFREYYERAGYTVLLSAYSFGSRSEYQTPYDLNLARGQELIQVDIFVR